MNMRLQQNVRMAMHLCLMLILVGLDQITKYVSVIMLKGEAGISIIDSVLELYYLENKGAAWGVLSGRSVLLIVITFIAIAFLMKMYVSLPHERKYNMARILITVIIAGAIGNVIDRIWHGYVIDFIYFSLINFPIFNVADSYVTVSIVLGLLIYRKEIVAWTKNG